MFRKYFDKKLIEIITGNWTSGGKPYGRCIFLIYFYPHRKFNRFKLEISGTTPKDHDRYISSLKLISFYDKLDTKSIMDYYNSHEHTNKAIYDGEFLIKPNDNNDNSDNDDTDNGRIVVEKPYSEMDMEELLITMSNLIDDENYEEAVEVKKIIDNKNG